MIRSFKTLRKKQEDPDCVVQVGWEPSAKQEVAYSIPSQGTHPDCRLNSWLVHVWEATD